MSDGYFNFHHPPTQISYILEDFQIRFKNAGECRISSYYIHEGMALRLYPGISKTNKIAFLLSQTEESVIYLYKHDDYYYLVTIE